ncbi:MAG: ribbon-helix-helix protein, CopG family [Sulfuritalea sp.]|nr:ribbon-helix-helix protein, CopG family [Sulfuritalea sp.]MDP1984754.1 ribbon-helix-helix protein, CopG family [Sulfuritalea sp.]
MTTLTMRIDAPMEAALASLAKATHRSKSDLAREMLRRQLAVRSLQTLREQALPHAEAAGYITDEDVFRDVS